MGVANVIEFGGVSSNDYDVVIEGPGEYTAPKRAYESIEIPGRNGSFILDKGHFENVDGKFKAVIKAETQLEFQKKVRDFKNAIVSQKGYQRLTELYHPDSYRMAAYKGGLDEEPEFIGKAAVFTLVFDCMPQRYLMSGEAEVDITSGETILNPTLFDAKPMLEVDGYGTININSDTVTVENVPLGETKLSDAIDAYTSLSVTLDTANLNADDPIYSGTANLPRIEVKIRVNTKKTTAMIVSSKTNCNETIVKSSNILYSMIVTPTNIEFAKGTSSSAVCTAGFRLTIGTGAEAVQGWMTATITTAYDATNEIISTSLAWDAVMEEVNVGQSDSVHIYYPAFIGNSSITILPSPMYIDLDIGEAYGIVNGVMTSFNNTTQLPANLPVLTAGNNTITYDNTVTSLKIIPRWWKI